MGDQRFYPLNSRPEPGQNRKCNALKEDRTVSLPCPTTHQIPNRHRLLISRPVFHPAVGSCDCASETNPMAPHHHPMLTKSTIPAVSRRTEILAGVSTFLATMYIIIVNPAILSQAGLPFSGVLTATVLLSFFCSLMMGLYARNPIVVAPLKEWDCNRR